MKFSLKPVAMTLLLSGTTSLHLAQALEPETATPGTLLAQTAVADKQTQAILSAWQNGDLHTISIADFKASPTALKLLLGAAFEADGDVAKATDIYVSLLENPALSAAQRPRIKLRLALLNNDIQALSNIANASPQLAFKIAKVVDIQSDITQAINIVEPLSTDSVPVQLTLATWLIDTGKFAQAAQTAWSGYTVAVNSSDKHYALALHAEALRKSNSIEKALTALSTYTDDPFLTPLYLDLLLEAGKVDKAIALTEKSKLESIQNRKGALLTLSGKQDALIEYYRELITLSPDEAEGYFGLAGQLVNQGDIAGAKEVFETLGKTNPDNKSLLLNAARRMIAMNLRDDAVQLLTTHINDAQRDPQINFFLFETYLNSGDEDLARDILAKLADTSATDTSSVLLAVSGYERLNTPEKALSLLQRYQNHGGRLSYDQQLHLANLAKAAGQNEVATAQWEKLWRQVTLPARKHFLEGLLVQAIQENGSVQRKLTQLQSALSSDNLSLQELNLLVALYISENDVMKAEDAINRYSQRQAVPQKQRLELLASLFGRSRTYEKLNAVWKTLAEIDPANASRYWQQITLNSIRNNAFDINNLESGESPQAYRLAQVNQLIANLTKNNQSDDPRFIASIYTMAGLPTKAIAQYQKAIETQFTPEALLQLVELYKQQGLFQQATRLLQVHLITASNQTEYMSAVDGLLNLFDSPHQNSGDTPSPALRTHTLNWLKRQLLTRLVFEDNDMTELMLLSDITQTQGEFDVAERINNLLLAQSAPQRATLLRSMITAFSGTNQTTPSSGPAIGDEQKKLQYGRRLLALKHDFPPALYASLGRSFLADNDIPAAERAFSLMTEIPGILNVKQLKGDAYVSQHMEKTALNYFQEALQVEQSDFELLRKTAVLQEQFDEDKIAGYWYWQGLKQLINQAPHYQATFSARRTSDSYKYFPTLSEGLLLTMKHQSDSREVMSELREMLQKSLKRIALQGQVHSDFNVYPRLSMIAELIQRIAFKQNAWSDWQASVGQIQRQFPGFKPVPQTLTVNQQVLAVSPLKNLQAQAKNDNNFKLVLALAVEKADWESVTSLASTLVKRINSEGTFSHVTGSNYFELLNAALDKMPDSHFTDKFWPVMTDIANKPLLMLQLQRFLPETFQQLERKLGAPLLSDPQFVSLAIEHINTPPFPGMPYSIDEDEFNALLLSRISPSELIDLWENVERHFSVTKNAAPIRDEIATNVFRQPIKPAHKEKVAGLLHHYITANKNGPAPCSTMAPKLMLLDIAPENQALVLSEANDIAVLSAQCAQLPAFLSLYYEGKSEQAYMALRALNKAAASGLSFPVFEDVTRRYFSQERQAYIEQFFTNSPISADDAHQFINEIISPENNVWMQQKYLMALHERLPGDEIIFNRLAHLLWQQKRLDELETLIAQSLKKDASTEDQHLLYFLHQLNRRTTQPDTNDAPPASNGQPISDIDSLVAWLNKSLSSGPENGGLTSLYSAVFSEYAHLYPKDELVIALQSRHGSGQAAAPENADKPDISRIVRTFRQNPHEAVRLLNTLWRNGIEGGKQFDGSALSREQLIHEFYDSKGHASARFSPQEDFLREMAAFPETSLLFENWLTAMPAELRGLEQRLYNLVAAGWLRQGTIDSRVSELLNKLSETEFTTHDLQLLVSAMPKSTVTASRQQLDLLRTRTQALHNASFYLRMGLADVFSRAGLVEEAGEWLVAAVWQMNFPALTLQTRVVQGRFNAPKLYDAVEQLRSWNNQQQARLFLAKIIHISQQAIGQSPELQNEWQAFILQAYAELGVPLEGAPSTLLQTAKDENSPVLTLARARYQRDIFKDNDGSAALVVSALTHFLNEPQNNHYNRELDDLLSRLYGPQSPLKERQTIMPWFESLIDSASEAWRQALSEKLANSRLDSDKLAPYLTYLDEKN